MISALVLSLALAAPAQQQRSLTTSSAPPVQSAPAASETPSDPARSFKPGPVRVTALDVSLVVNGHAMRVVQKIELTNPAGRPQEFDLIFPLGNGSVIGGLDLKTGDGLGLEGIVYDAAAARDVYMQITRANLDPALLEHYGEGLYRARVSPVPAGGTQTLVLSYTRVVEPEGDLLRLHLPLSAFRRSAGPVALTIHGDITADAPLTTLYSPTHSLDQGVLEELGGTPPRFRTVFTATQEVSDASLDFLAFYKARSLDGILEVSVLSERPDPSEDGFFLAVIDGIPGDDLPSEPKDVVFVLDRSGSMEGVKIEQAQAALKFMVERLAPGDRFNLISYAEGVEVFAAEFLKPTTENITSAHTFIDGIEAVGGTNIEEALGTAVGLFPGAERVNQVVFITDGLPTVGERDHRVICRDVKKANEHGARVVAFGVGFDVNGTFLDRLAVGNRGMSEYVLPSENIEDKVPGFYARMKDPLLIDTALEVVGASVYDLFPRETGDIYGGHQILLTGRYRVAAAIDETTSAAEPAGFPAAAVEPTLRISGRRGGEDMTLSFPLDLAVDNRTGNRDLVARMWAAKKVGFLIDEIRLEGQDDELVSAIVRLGTRFGILTEYTSFLAADSTDLLAFADNFDTCGKLFEEMVKVEAGTQGVAQAANSKLRQRASQVETTSCWYDQDGMLVAEHGVQCVNGKTLFRRADIWIDAACGAEPPEEEVEFCSSRYFDLLDQNAWLPAVVARTGEVVVLIGGKRVLMKG
jgi:Ca-activated chloride channel family protein